MNKKLLKTNIQRFLVINNSLTIVKIAKWLRAFRPSLVRSIYTKAIGQNLRDILYNIIQICRKMSIENGQSKIRIAEKRVVKTGNLLKNTH